MLVKFKLGLVCPKATAKVPDLKDSLPSKGQGAVFGLEDEGTRFPDVGWLISKGLPAPRGIKGTLQLLLSFKKNTSRKRKRS